MHQLIADGGVAAVTYRSVGAIVGLSASSIHDNYPQRAHLLKVAAYHLARRREEYFAARVPREGLGAMLPETEFDLRQARIWLALRAFARTEPLLGLDVDETRSRERLIVGVALQRRPDDPASEAVHCLLEGLESARTTGDEPMSYDRASEVLEVVLTALRSVPAAALAVAPGAAR